jgi:hypothetical protein
MLFSLIDLPVNHHLWIVLVTKTYEMSVLYVVHPRVRALANAVTHQCPPGGLPQIRPSTAV